MINYRLKPKRNKLKTTVEINEILVALPFVFHTYRIVLPHVKEYILYIMFFVYDGVMYSGEYDVCDVTLSVHPHRPS